MSQAGVVVSRGAVVRLDSYSGDETRGIRRRRRGLSTPVYNESTMFASLPMGCLTEPGHTRKIRRFTTAWHPKTHLVDFISPRKAFVH